jgi:putative membrane protein
MVPLILRSWSWQPVILLGLLAAAIGYAYGFYDLRRHGRLENLMQRGLIRRRQPWYFAAGLLTIFIALLSPIDVLAEMLFLMHMVQHVLLMTVAPSLILRGLPAPLARLLIQETRLRGVLTWLTHPFVAYLFFNANLLSWHVPAAYEAALRDDIIHDLQHALFFYTALFFWWRVLDPTDGWFPFWKWPPAKWLYLTVSAPPSVFLGTILWTTDAVWYPLYAQVPRLWGLSALADQHIGGLIMWIQGWMFVMLSIAAFFIGYNPEQEPV